MAYGFHTPVTIQSSKVEANHSNFPILIMGTFDGTSGEADLRTTANGGKIENTVSTGGISGSLTVPADFVISPNSDGSSPYDFEWEYYDPATGEIIVWVKIPTMDSSADQTIYMVYGDSTVTTNQEDISNVWDSNFYAVLHCGGGGTGDLADSSGNGNNFADQSADTGSTGKIGEGRQISYGDGYSGGDIDWASFTWSLFFYTTQNDRNVLLSDRQGVDHTHVLHADSSNNTLYLQIGAGGDSASATVSQNTWYRISAGYDASTDIGKILFNNTLYNLGDLGAHSNNNRKFKVGASDSDYKRDNLTGYVDEIRLSDVRRTDEWMQTEENSFDVSTFLSFGSETTSIQSVIQSVMLGANF